MLKRCSVTLVETDGRGEETWRAEGTDIDGRSIVAVVVAYQTVLKIKIVTCWAKRDR